MKKLLLLIFSLLFLQGCGFEQVDTGHRGIKTRFGLVDEKLGSLPEGLYFYNPFTSSIIEIDTRVQKKQTEANTYTKDVQQANITYVINYYLEKDKAHFMYREVGKKWEDILVPQAVEGALKGVVGHWDAVDLVGNREKARSEAESVARATLAQKYVTVTRLELVNIQFLKEFEKAVEAKVIATQRAAEAINNTKRIEEEQKQRLIVVKVEAESIRIQGQALASNPKLIDWELAQAAKKWDGKMPEYMLGNAALPFLNISPK